MNLVASAVLRGAIGPSSYAEYYGTSSWHRKSRNTAFETGGAPELGNGPSKESDPALSRQKAQSDAARQQAASKL